MGLTRRSFLQWLGGSIVVMAMPNVPVTHPDPKAYKDLMAELATDKRVLGIFVSSESASPYRGQVAFHAANGEFDENWLELYEPGKPIKNVKTYFGKWHRDRMVSLRFAMDKWHKDMV